ncbi:hypothetical protein L596_002252 [Steinernema carpocapsae]|uniref:Uncharacterized protein n=1 Tax=Steinernema carpocapsae TaxID=34508 RepID=A0A4U8URC6_STECR|nr:hypothetical protein L596_002252 [Steinernema carpocapsae]
MSAIWTRSTEGKPSIRFQKLASIRIHNRPSGTRVTHYSGCRLMSSPLTVDPFGAARVAPLVRRDDESRLQSGSVGVATRIFEARVRFPL